MYNIEKLSLTEKIILYLVYQLKKRKRSVLVGRTRIMKLLYLVDLVAKYRLGKTITGSRYFYHFFGPYSEEIQDAIISLTEKGLLLDKPVLTNVGQAHDYDVKSEPPPALPLKKEEKLILDEILKKFGRKKLEDLVATTYQTPPMKTAKPEEIVLS
jgi:uncharacterized protein YwgA